MQQPRTLCMTVGAVVFMVAAMWSGDTHAEAQQQHRTAVELTGTIRTLQHQVDETIATLEGLQRRVVNAEERIASFITAAGMHVLDRTATIPDPPSGKVALRLGFQYLPKPLPGQGIQAYEPVPEVQSLWAMESLPKGQPVPRGAAIEARTLFLAPGESRMVTLVYDNPTAQEVGFLVLPHQESPGSLAPMVWPTCLCMSYVYQAPAGGAWYRVIRLTASPDIPTGSKVDILWTTLTDSAVFPTE